MTLQRQMSQQTQHFAGVRCLEDQFVHEEDAAVGSLIRKCSPDRIAPHLARNFIFIRMRPRAKDHASGTPLGGTWGTLAGAPSAFLAVRLLTAAAYLGACLRAGRSLTTID